MPLSMFTKMLCLNYEEGNFAPEYWKRIDKITKEKVLLPADSSQVKNHLKDADCLLLKVGMVADKAAIDSMPRLKYIGINGTAFGRIDVAYAKKKSIAVCNVPGYATESVAEFVFAALLENLREVTRAKIQAQTGNFSESSYTGTEIKGKTFGVIGLGRIGGRVAELAKGFGANVVYWSHKRKTEAEKAGIKYTDADTLIRTSDIISLHMSFNPETKGFLGRQTDRNDQTRRNRYQYRTDGAR